ncbi:MAG: RNA polymerase-binding ATPase, partial [Verrucomicrobiota bacterium]
KADVSGRFEKKKFEDLVSESRDFHDDLTARLERGRDHLLEMNSFRPEKAAELVAGIKERDEDPHLEVFFLDILDHFGVSVEDLSPGVFFLKPDHLFTDAFPSLKEEGTTVTLDRTTALSREDMQFITWDHPMVREAIELLLSSEQGNTSFAYIDIPEPKMLLLECVFLVECVAPAGFHLDRFFPATPVRILVNHRGEDYSEKYSPDDLAEVMRAGKAQWVQKNSQTLQALIPKLMGFCQSGAEEKVKPLISRNRDVMEQKLRLEIDRLRHLKSINDHVRDDEILMAEENLRVLSEAMDGARLRLDSMRLLFREE